MLKFDMKTFNVNGNKFAIIHARFSLKNGIELEVTDRYVSVRGGIIPDPLCDFTANSSSCNSSNFYEVSGLPEVNTIFMPSKCGFYVYCLPENLEQVKDRVVNHMANALNDYRDKQLIDLETIKISIDDLN